MLVFVKYLYYDSFNNGAVTQVAQILSSLIGLFHLLWAQEEVYIVWGALCDL